MLARLTAARRLPQVLGLRYSSGSFRSEGSVGQSKEFGCVTFYTLPVSSPHRTSLS